MVSTARAGESMFVRVDDEPKGVELTTTTTNTDKGWSLSDWDNVIFTRLCEDFKKIYRDNISKALDETHYAKDGKLYRRMKS